MVAFAAGSLLGDVFIHLLPETYTELVLGTIINVQFNLKEELISTFF